MCGATLTLLRLPLHGAYSGTFTFKQSAVSKFRCEKEIANRYIEVRMTLTLSKLGQLKLYQYSKNAFH